MARPTKEGLDYFPLNVDIDQDEKVGLVEAAHGLMGFAIVVKLFMKIYKESYFIKWGEREQLLFSKKVDVDIPQVNKVIDSCLSWGLFDRKLFKKANILTSHGIQLRYLEATRRRNKVKIYKEYSLLRKTEINDFNNIVFVNIYSDDANIYPQSKEEKSKEEESKEEESKEKERKYITDIYNHYLSKNIIIHKKLTNEMRTQIVSRLKDYSFHELIKAIDNYSSVLHSPIHYFDYKYPLGNLMKATAISMFLDEADPINNFKGKGKDKTKAKKGVVSHEEVADGLDEYNFEGEFPLGF